MPSPFAEVLRDLAAAFTAARVDYYLFGAQAALVHGAVRLTADVDVTVRMEPEDPVRLIAAVQAHGFVSRISDQDFITQTRVLPLRHERTGIGADIVLAGPGIEELFLERAQMCEIGGVAFKVACAEDVIVLETEVESWLHSASRYTETISSAERSGRGLVLVAPSVSASAAQAWRSCGLMLTSANRV
jgi:hypothetical protein